MKVNDFLKDPKFLGSVLDTMSDGLMVVDREGTILSFNPAAEKITGYSSAEVVGRPCSILDTDTCVYREGDRTEIRCSLFRDGKAVRKNCRIRAKDGSEVHLLKNATVLRDESGEMVAGIETMTDVTSMVIKDLQIQELVQSLKDEGVEGIIGRNGAILKVHEQIRNAARSEAPVIILGESGTGKELVAAAIHNLSRRREGPFIRVNCAALNEHLLESELFGHRKGSFTGAMRDRQGRFEAAGGGTIFLDEIGDTPVSMQAKLLRVLEEKEIERVGENLPVSVDIRLITATNKDLAGLVKSGEFREDFLYRVNVIPISLPPLRERADDIPLLVSHFLRKICATADKEIVSVTPSAMEEMQCYCWPGNIRQLINTLEYAVITCRGDSIDVADLPGYLFGDPSCSSPSRRRSPLSKDAVAEALRQTGGNRTRAAKTLGISRVTLWKKIKAMGLEGAGK
jgi:two-component system response regulator HydG